MSNSPVQAKDAQPLSTQGYRGTRDFYPELQRLRSWMYGHIKNVLEGYGYEEYDGPILEPLELYASKSSEEIVSEQLYSFDDRGGRKVGIRPEMTPTLARMVASRAKELVRPIRWYSIPTCMRYERPQRGRLREFDQLNVDVFGGTPLDEDIEVLLTCHDLMVRLGAKPSDFEIKINHRGLVDDLLFGVLNLNTSQKSAILRLLDKKDKLSAEAFREEAGKLWLSGTDIEKLEQFMSQPLSELRPLMGDKTTHLDALSERLACLQSVIPAECIRFDASIMRGFDYYTGLVFEIYDKHPDNRRALFGGGRYDNLVGAFGTDPLAGIGYGVSDVSLLNFLEVHNLTPVLSKKTEVAVIRFSEADRPAALALSRTLRELGLNVETTLSAAKFGKQIQWAERTGAKAVVFRGEDELKNGTFACKWLATGVQEIFPMNDPEEFSKKLSLV
ncbi:MAG: histidine--tRNA ligase [Proteobacteria bacterium]|nr:histidine--tRNA ligase [Pseudomonadota bacterium]